MPGLRFQAFFRRYARARPGVNGTLLFPRRLIGRSLVAFDARIRSFCRTLAGCAASAAFLRGYLGLGGAGGVDGGLTVEEIGSAGGGFQMFLEWDCLSSRNLCFARGSDKRARYRSKLIE